MFCISAACFLFGPTMDPLDFTSHGGWAAALAIFAKAPVAETAVELAGFAGLQLGDVLSLPLALLVVLATSEVLVPLIGNISPKRASFLASRRYCELHSSSILNRDSPLIQSHILLNEFTHQDAGNWAGGVWLVRKSAWHKLSRIKTLSSPITDQLRSIYGESEVEAAVARLMGFRVMHLNSRILPRALSLAVSRATGTTHGGRSKPKPLFSDYQYMVSFFNTMHVCLLIINQVNASWTLIGSNNPLSLAHPYSSRWEIHRTGNSSRPGLWAIILEMATSTGHSCCRRCKINANSPRVSVY